MSLLKWAIFGLLMLPMAEIAIFVAVALQIGFLAALALTVLTSLAGMAVIRNAGRSDDRAHARRTRRRRHHAGWNSTGRAFSPCWAASCCCCRAF